MFFKLVSRNSRRSRRENDLFFASLLVSIVAFYMILSLAHQDVMVFLARVESDAVSRLLTMIPLFYGMTLVILFFLIYYASKFQLERRRHEFGVYLMMGMRRSRLFFLLLAEDLRGSILALALGLPGGFLLSEVVSLVTARLVGLDIVGHQITFSGQAVLWTAAGFLLIKLGAFLILSGKIAGQEIGGLLTDAPEGTKKQAPAPVYGLALALGLLCLGTAYAMAISGISWYNVKKMGLTLVLGFGGTLLLFYGLRAVMAFFVRRERDGQPLRIFNFRQLQETVIRRSGTLAISSLLILAALCCFGSGVAIACYYGESEPHVLDYTFEEEGQDGEEIRGALAAAGLDRLFSRLFEMRVGYIRRAEDYDSAFQMESVLSSLSGLPQSQERDVLLNNLSYATYPHVIGVGGYNELLAAAGGKELELGEGEAAVYIDREFTNDERTKLMNQVLESRPEVMVDGEPWRLTGKVQTTGLVTDRSITLSFALILPDEAFEAYTLGDYNIYLNGILSEEARSGGSLLGVISKINEKLDGTGLSYESYLQNMGRQLFYMVAASYITIYLAIIFLIIANTVIGVQFLMGQQKTGRRYRTLIRLGATYETLCQSAGKQINWYFGIPSLVAALSSLFGVRALFTGLLSPRTQGSLSGRLWAAASMILILCLVEWLYMAAVKRSSSRYLLTLMVPEREE